MNNEILGERAQHSIDILFSSLLFKSLDLISGLSDGSSRLD